MNAQLDAIAKKLAASKTAQDVFGSLIEPDRQPLQVLKTSYHALVRITHPDLYSAAADQLLAQELLAQLNEWFAIAQQQLTAGAYGQDNADQRCVLLHTKKHSYTVENVYTKIGLFNTYPCSFEEPHGQHPAVLKVIRDNRDNDLAQNEIGILKTLHKGLNANKFSAYLPACLDAFTIDDSGSPHQAAVFERWDGWYSLEEVRQRYPAGIDPRDMAWIWRRLLAVLGFAHRTGVIHNAVLPGSVWILPDQHGLMLTDWCLAACDTALSWQFHERVDSRFIHWYAPETLAKGRLSPGTDTNFSARCMLYLLGADPCASAIPSCLPGALKAFLKGSLLPDLKAPQDAWALMQEFDQCLDKLWGKRKFHPFTM